MDIKYLAKPESEPELTPIVEDDDMDSGLSADQDPFNVDTDGMSAAELALLKSQRRAYKL